MESYLMNTPNNFKKSAQNSKSRDFAKCPSHTVDCTYSIIDLSKTAVLDVQQLLLYSENKYTKNVKFSGCPDFNLTRLTSLAATRNPVRHSNFL